MMIRAKKQAMKQLYPEEPRGNLARHLETLAGLVTGIVLGKSCQLPKIASKIAGEVQPDSRVKQMKSRATAAKICLRGLGPSRCRAAGLSSARFSTAG